MYKFLDRLLPNETRGWLALGVFLLMAYILSLVAFVKDVDKSQLFTALASGIVGAAFGSIASYYFGTSKGSTERNEIMGKAMDLAKQSPIRVEPPANISIEETDNDSGPK